MTDKVNHLHQMVTGLQGLWHISTATMGIPDMETTQELVRFQEIGLMKIQDV